MTDSKVDEGEIPDDAGSSRRGGGSNNTTTHVGGGVVNNPIIHVKERLYNWFFVRFSLDTFCRPGNGK